MATARKIFSRHLGARIFLPHPRRLRLWGHISKPTADPGEGPKGWTMASTGMSIMGDWGSGAESQGVQGQSPRR